MEVRLFNSDPFQEVGGDLVPVLLVQRRANQLRPQRGQSPPPDNPAEQPPPPVRRLQATPPVQPLLASRGNSAQAGGRPSPEETVCLPLPIANPPRSPRNPRLQPPGPPRDPPVKLRARFAPSGRAAGRVEDLAGLFRCLDERCGQYDAVAVSSVVDVPHEFHLGYFEAKGGMVNPWGGVEAMLSHALSSYFNVPTAHAPMFESQEVANLDPGIVDPRMAAEAVSVTFLQCILKGLQRSPRIVTDEMAMARSGVLTAEDVSCLVIPDGCLGLPTLAALEQGITVIAVRENRNVMKNDLSTLPWKPGQFHRVENYWEAAGIIAAIRAGIAAESVRRPLEYTRVSTQSMVRFAEPSVDQDNMGR